MALARMYARLVDFFPPRKLETAWFFCFWLPLRVHTTCYMMHELTSSFWPPVSLTFSGIRHWKSASGIFCVSGCAVGCCYKVVRIVWPRWDVPGMQLSRYGLLLLRFLFLRGCLDPIDSKKEHRFGMYAVGRPVRDRCTNDISAGRCWYSSSRMGLHLASFFVCGRCGCCVVHIVVDRVHVSFS